MPLPVISWLASKIRLQSTDPQPHYPHLWTGGKFLGKGANGQTTLWTYIGPPTFKTLFSTSSLPLSPPPSPKTPHPNDPFPHLLNKSIVLKTALDSLALVAFRAEYYVMVQLLQRNESHITKIITGIGTADRDRNKIYLEYCKGGDLDGEIKRRLKREVTGKRKRGAMEEEEGEKRLLFTEEELWRMLVCLAKAAVAMGRERQFLHMDMHAGNILIGDIGGEDHSCKSLKPQYKIADFGVVMEWDGQLDAPHDNPDGIDARQNSAAEFFHVEDFHPSAPCPTFGERCNVWGIGLIMYQALFLSLTTPSRADPDSDSNRPPALSNRYKSDFGADILPIGWKYGRPLETADMYSEKLRVTIQYCLMEDYNHRISSQELLDTAEHFARRYKVDSAARKGDAEWVWVF